MSAVPAAMGAPAGGPRGHGALRWAAAALMLAVAALGPPAVLASDAGDLPHAIAHWCAASLAASAAALLITGRPFGRTLAVAAQAAVFAALATCSVALVYVAMWWRFSEAASAAVLVNCALGVLAAALVALAVARGAYRSAPMRRFFEGRPDRRDLTRQMAVLCAACIAMATLNTWLFAHHAVSLVHLQPPLLVDAGAVEAAIAQAFGLRAWYVAATVASLLVTLTLVAHHRDSPASRELRLASARAQATLDEIAHAVFTVDAKGRILSANRGAEALFGQALPTLLGASLADRLAPAPGGTPDDTPAQDAQDAPGPGLGNGEHRLRRCDGAVWPVDVASRRFVFDDRTLYAVIVRDLRADKQTTALLARWEQVFVNAGWGVAVVAPDLQSARLANPEFARMHGYGIDELLALPWPAIVAPDARPDLQHHLAAAGSRGHLRFESRHVRRGGGEFPVLVDATCVRDAEGRLLFHVVNVQDITAQAAAREALRHSEALLSLVLDNLPVGVCVADRDGTIVRTNAALDRLCIGPSLPGRTIARAARRGLPFRRQRVALDCLDGARRVLLHAATPLRDATGAVQGAVSVTQDITASSRAEQELRRTKVFFETTFQSAAVGMAVLDTDGTITRINAAFSQLVGRDKAALLLTRFHELLHPEERQQHAERRLSLAAGRPVAYPIECRLLCAGGRQVWVSLAVAMVSAAEDGRPQYIVQAMNVDESHRMRDSLIASEVRLANAQRIARLGDWLWDLDTGLVRCSVQAWALLGLAPSVRRQLTSDAFLERVAPEDRAAVSALLEAARHGMRPLSLDHRLAAPEGGTRIVQQQVEAERDARGTARCVVGTIQDITERKRIELELDRSQHLLRALAAHGDERLEEERKHIAREVHDELGGLVTALRMELSMLRARLGGDPELLAQADGMRGLLDRTVGVVRQVASNLRPSALDLGLAAAIEWLAEDFSLRWEIPCTLRVEDGELELPDAVATAAFRVVQESLTNVARHAGASRVDIVLQRRGALVSLAVTDDGCGFDASDGGPREGFGLLGMQERMRNIGGRLSVHSGDAGTTIQIEFPAT